MSSRETRETLISRFLNASPPVPRETFNDPEPELNFLEKARIEKIKNKNIYSEIQNEPQESKKYQQIIHKEKPEATKPFQDNHPNERSLSQLQEEAKMISDEIKCTDQKPKNKRAHDKNKSEKTLKKNYYPEMLESMEHLKLDGKSLFKIYEVFVEGLPLGWTQEEFNNFAESLKFSSLFSRRMFKSEHGVCNGKAFFNFKDENEANQFIKVFHGSSLFGKVMNVTLKNTK